MLVRKGKKACPPSNQPFAKAFLGHLHMSITECSVHRQGQIHYCVSKLQVPTSYHGNWPQTPLSPAAAMVHDIRSDTGHPTGSSPCHRLCLRGCTQSKDLFSRLWLRETSLNSTDLRLDFFLYSHEESFAFLLQSKSKVSFGCSSENFKSYYVLAITAT